MVTVSERTLRCAEYVIVHDYKLVPLYMYLIRRRNVKIIFDKISMHQQAITLYSGFHLIA